MSGTTAARGVGELLRDWRRRRHMSQLALAVGADVSSRHLSFVETGRAHPSRELILHLAEQLEVPLRERNSLLLAAGFAPVYRETSLDAAEMAPVRAALDKILAGLEPFPSIVVNRRWDVVSANRSAMASLIPGVAQELLTAPINLLRVSLHPRGLAPRIVNLGEYSRHVMQRLHRQALLSGDPDLVALEQELRQYPGVMSDGPRPAAAIELLFTPLVVRAADDVQYSFFSTLTTFGTAGDITFSELAVESFFPADEATASALRIAHP